MSDNSRPIRQRKATCKATVSSSCLKSARKTRTKTRKPKYLSLKLELSPKKKKEASPEEPANNKLPHPHKQQLMIDLFPLHPKNNLVVQDRSSDMQDDHVAAAFFFQTATEDTSSTLQDILDTTATTATTTTTTTTTTTATTSEEGPLSPTLTYVSGRYDVRTAIRCKERDASEERWVSYCEVVKTEQEEESGSCGGGSGGDGRGCGGGDASGNIMERHDHGDQKRLVGLKLDYEDILNAWSDKGPLYMQGEFPQTVPDLHDGPNGLTDGLGHWGGLCTVPEMDGMKMMENEGTDGRKAGQREASVSRYKEKRQSRLFSKRIRYEVRKLNAERRPRLKGRFVKRS